MATKSLAPENGDNLNKKAIGTNNSQKNISRKDSKQAQKPQKRSKGAKQQVEAIEKLSTNALPRKKLPLDAIAKAAVIALSAGATVITPAVVYYKKNERYEVSIQSEVPGFQAQTLSLKRGATITMLKQNLDSVVGHHLVGIYRDAECTIPFADTDKVKKDTTVYLKYARNKYSVKIPQSEKYSINYSTAVDINSIEWGEAFAFRIDLEGDYQQSEIKVFANGVELTPYTNGYYSVAFMEEDVEITVEGVELNEFDFSNLDNRISIYNIETGEKLEKATYGDEVRVTYTETDGCVMETFKVNKQVAQNNCIVEINSSFRVEFSEVDAYGLTFIENSDHVEISKCDGSVENVVIPSVVYNKPVTIIDSEAFKSSAVKTVTLPSSIESIKTSAFLNCSSLTSVTLNEGLTFIGSYAFKQTALESIEIPASVTTISEGAFENCEALKTVAFAGTSQISAVRKRTTVKAMLKTTSNTSKLQTIEARAFAGSAIETINIPNSVATLGNETFAGCVSLKEVQLPESLTTIVKGMFKESGLQSLTLTDNITEIGASAFDGSKIKSIVLPKNLTQIGEKAFYQCGELTNIQLPQNLKILGDYAFANTALEELTIEENVEEIKANIVSGTSCNLKIAKSEFSNTGYSLNVYNGNSYYTFENENYFLHYEKTAETEYEIPSDVTIIPAETFRNSDLSKVTFGKQVTTIRISAFAGSAIESITIPAGLTTIEDDAFADCLNLVSVTIDNATIYSAIINQESLGGLINNASAINVKASISNKTHLDSAQYFMFYGDSTGVGYNIFSPKPDVNTTEFIIPEGVTTINPSTFMGNVQYTSISLPSTLKKIGDNAFNNSKIETITIPSAVSEIGASAFTNCNNLSEVTINSQTIYNGISSINSWSNLLSNAIEIKIEQSIDEGSNEFMNGGDSFVKFQDNTHYYYVFVNGNVDTTVKYDKLVKFNGATYLGINDEELHTLLHIGDKTVAEYEIASGVKVIAGNVFSSSLIESIAIPESVEEIRADAFNQCSNLESLTFSEGLEIIGDNAFYNCSKLENVQLPKSLKTLGDYSFALCSALKTLIVENNVEQINKNIVSGTSCNLKIAKSDVSNSGYSLNVYNGNSYYTFENENYFLHYERNNATSYSIPSDVTIIQAQTFANSKLEEVILPDGLTTIGGEAFRNCKNLKEITLPSSISDIGTAAFYQCENLDVVEINSSKVYLAISNMSSWGGLVQYAKEIKVNKDIDGVGASTNGFMNTRANFVKFQDDSHYYYVYVNGNVDENIEYTQLTTLNNATYLGIDGNAYHTLLYMDNREKTSLIINEDCVEIAGNAFKNASLESVTIPESVQTIRKYAFYNNLALKEVNFSKGLKTIQEAAFQHCEKLQNVTLPEGLTTLQGYSFSWCYDLEQVNLPSTITSYGSGMFKESGSLSKVYLSKAEGQATLNLGLPKNYKFENATKYIYDIIKDETATSYTVPSEATIISSNTFHSSSLSEIILPEGLERIDDAAFYNCSNLANINLPSSLKIIGEEAFGKCVLLTSVTLPDGVESIGSESFVECSNLEEVNLPNGLSNIGARAFARAINLKTINLPTSLSSIPNEMFNGCVSLTSIEIPDNITSIGYAAFYRTGLTSVRISEFVQSIENEAFDYCENLTKVTIESEAVYTSATGTSASQAGAILEKATEIHVPVNMDNGSSITNAYLMNSNFARLDGSTYRYIYSKTLTTVNVPSDVTMIPNEAFMYSSLENITLPDGIISIGDSAFYNSKLTSIDLPNSIETIGASAFRELGIEDLTLPTSLKTIGDYAFYQTDVSELISIPNLIESIGNYAFNGSTVNNLIIPASVKSLGMGVFSVNGSLTISNNSMLGANLNSSFIDGGSINAITIGSGITSLDNFAFTDFTSTLTSVDLSNCEVTTLPNSAFADCVYLETVELPTNLTSIGTYAFYNSGITSLTLPTGVTTINNGTFRGCERLTTLDITNITSIGEYAFADTGFETVTLTDNLKSIGNYAFEETNITTFNWIGDIDSYLAITMGNKYSSPMCGGGTMKIGESVDSLSDVTEVVVPTTLTDANYSYYHIDKFNALTSITFEQGSTISTFTNNMISTSADLVTIGVPDAVTDISSFDFRIYRNTLTNVYMANSQIIELKYNSNEVYVNEYYEYYDLYNGNLFESYTDHVEYGIFQNCSKLTSVTLPTTLNNIHAFAFEGTNLTNINGSTSLDLSSFSSLAQIGYAAFNNTKITSLSLPSSLNIIGDVAFYNCNSLTSATIAGGIKYFGTSAFRECSKLKDLVLNCYFPHYDGYILVGNSIFENCSSIKSVTIPDGMYSEYTETKRMFAGCSNLESVGFKIAEFGFTIGESMFEDCTKLTWVNLPEREVWGMGGSYTIETNAFKNCTSLTRLLITSACEEIKVGAFNGCTNLLSTCPGYSCSKNHLAYDNHGIDNTAEYEEVTIYGYTQEDIESCDVYMQYNAYNWKIGNGFYLIKGASVAEYSDRFLVHVPIYNPGAYTCSDGTVINNMYVAAANFINDYGLIREYK